MWKQIADMSGEEKERISFAFNDFLRDFSCEIAGGIVAMKMDKLPEQAAAATLQRIVSNTFIRHWDKACKIIKDLHGLEENVPASDALKTFTDMFKDPEFVRIATESVQMAVQCIVTLIAGAAEQEACSDGECV